MMKDTLFPGLLFAFNLNGRGGAEAVPETEIRTNLRADGTTWVHLDYSAEGIQEWLSDVGGLDDVAVAALTADEPRPRCFRHGDGVVLMLRGVNQNPGHDREDMVSIRIWVGPHGVISMRQRRLMAPQQISKELQEGTGPTHTGELVVRLNEIMCGFIAEVISDLETTLDELEENIITLESHTLRRTLTELRRETISIRRYLAPQRDALASLQSMRPDWLNEMELLQMRELGDRTLRYVEDLDSMRERAMLMYEELTGRLAERMNRIMFFLSIVTGIFLPLGLLTGLLGINVGGMPGTDAPQAFWVVCALLGGMAGLQLWLFKKMKWF